MKDALLETLGVAVFIRDPDDSFHLTGKQPAWVAQFWPEIAKSRILDTGSDLGSLKNFLIEANTHWQTNVPGSLQSRKWEAHSVGGDGGEFVATAARVGKQAVLLVQRLPITHPPPASGRNRNDEHTEAQADLHGTAAATGADGTLLSYLGKEICTPINGLIETLEHVLHSSLSVEQRAGLETAQNSAKDSSHPHK